MSKPNICHHGVSHPKGCEHLGLGNFDKLFPNLAPLAVSETHAAVLGASGGMMHDAENSSGTSNIPSGYTFLAQFIDHDITLDAGTKLSDSAKSHEEIQKLSNMRSASLDLDCVYAFGPEVSPTLYDPDAPGRLLTGNAANPDDLPRNEAGTALIGDPRNDENLFISQTHLVMLRFHNKNLDRLVSSVPAGARFEVAQRSTRFHYQWIVLYDFLKRVCHPEIYQWVLDRWNGKKKFPLFYGPNAHGKLPMPVEFSVAAYRFGHTMVRSNYSANGAYPDLDLFDEAFGTTGFRPVPPKLVLDWRHQFPVDPCFEPTYSMKIDHFMADELINLPFLSKGTPLHQRSLAFRNLLRSNVMALASGQDVAAELANAGYPLAGTVDLDWGNLPGWNDVDPGVKDEIEAATPLFFYILREAGVGGGNHLGPVGSAILLEFFGGILKLCKTSFLHEPGWQPDPCIALNGPDDFTFADIIRYVQS